MSVSSSDCRLAISSPNTDSLQLDSDPFGTTYLTSSRPYHGPRGYRNESKRQYLPFFAPQSTLHILQESLKQARSKQSPMRVHDCTTCQLPRHKNHRSNKRLCILATQDFNWVSSLSHAFSRVEGLDKKFDEHINCTTSPKSPLFFTRMHA